MYVKRQTIEKSWPIPRKGTKYVIAPSHNKKYGLPVLIILRDMMKIAKNRNETKKILGQGKVLVENKMIKKENFSVSPFDLIKIGDKEYELGFSDKGKFELKETGRKENISKIVGKKMLKNKRVQLNFLYGKNIILNEKTNAKIGDSVFVKDKKIIKVLPLEEGREAVIFAGRSRGKEGKIKKIEKGLASIICGKKEEEVNVPLKNILVVR